MKKKLKWIIPLCLAILIVIGALTLVLRYRSAGETQLRMISHTSERTDLVQIREKGAKTTRLSGTYSTNWVYSPNERYAACSLRDGGKTVCRVYDLSAPKKPLLEVEATSRQFLVTDQGKLILLQGGTLCLADESGSMALAVNVSQLGGLGPDGLHLYYFTEPEEDQFTLWEYDLSTQTPTQLLDDADPFNLQLCRDAQGRQIVVAAQKLTLTGTAYDQVIDADPTRENPLREKLKAISVSQDVRTLYRWVDGQMELLAENMAGQYFCDPSHGLVVHRTATLAQPVTALEELRYASVPESRVWYCSLLGSRSELAGLRGQDAADVSPVFSSQGDILVGTTLHLYRYRWEGGVLTEESLLDAPDAFTVLRSAAGEDTIYALSGGTLYRLQGALLQPLAEDVTRVWLPCNELPDGTKQSLGDLIYLMRYYDETTDTVSATYQKRPHADPPDSRIYLLQGGQERALLQANRSELNLSQALPDGSVLAVQTGKLVGMPISGRLGWVLGPERVEKLRVNANGAALGSTCVVRLN